MKKIILVSTVVFALVSLSSCMRGITPEQAANGKAKCGRYNR